MKNPNVTKTKSVKITSATKKPGGRVGGTMANISAQKTAKGKVGGISKAPATALPKAKMGGMMKKQVGGPATKPVAKGTPNTNRYVQSTPSGGYNEISARQYATTPQNQRAGMQELNQSQYDSNKSRISPMKAKKGGMVKMKKK